MKLFPKTELPGRVVLSLKALLLYVLIIHDGFIKVSLSRLPYLPFLKFLDTVPWYLFSLAGLMLLLSIILVFFKKGNYRLLSFGSGLIILLLVLSSKLLFSNSLTFTACLLVLIGLYRGSDTIFRIQISLLFLGAAINKMFDPDWWNGYFFDYFLRNVFQARLYDSFVPVNNLVVARFFGMATIFYESLLGIIVLIPKLTRSTIFLGLIFHAGMLVITLGELSVRFLYIMSAAYLLISGLTISPVHIGHHSRIIATLLSWMDFSGSLIPQSQKQKNLTVTIENNTYTGKEALGKLLLSKQYLGFFYFTFLIVNMIYPKIVNGLILPVLRHLL